MTQLHNIARIGAIYLSIKGAAFLLAAALEWTPLPPLFLGGMALTWLAGGVLLGWQARRAGRRLVVREPEEAVGDTGRFSPSPRRG